MGLPFGPIAEINSTDCSISFSVIIPKKKECYSLLYFMYQLCYPLPSVSTANTRTPPCSRSAPSQRGIPAYGFGALFCDQSGSCRSRNLAPPTITDWPCSRPITAAARSSEREIGSVMYLLQDSQVKHPCPLPYLPLYMSFLS